MVPAALLRPRFESTRSTVPFSATLRPPRYYADLLGPPDNTAWSEVASPFQADQLQARVARRISTRFRDRPASLVPIADLIADQYRQRPGNYLAFFSSYDYLDQALATLRQRHLDLTVWAQDRRMDEAARDAFLERFQAHSQGIGFAVLGGAFAEGRSTSPGARLIGAFVATSSACRK